MALDSLPDWARAPWMHTAVAAAALLLVAWLAGLLVRLILFRVVRTMAVDAPSSGLTQFSWDGKDDAGNALPSGSYKMAASNAGSSFDTYVAGKVTAVGYGGSDVGTYLQVAGVGGVALSQVAQIL